MSDFKIQEISAEATFAVRHPVLRAGKPLESCQFDGDNLRTTHHFGLYESATLVAVVSVFENRNPLFAEQHQVQLRGMAVLENYRGKDYGVALVRHVEDRYNNSGLVIWFNAREIAVGFYEKLGYNTIGDVFNIGDIGPHYLMHKRF